MCSAQVCVRFMLGASEVHVMFGSNSDQVRFGLHLDKFGVRFRFGVGIRFRLGSCWV